MDRYLLTVSSLLSSIVIGLVFFLQGCSSPEMNVETSIDLSDQLNIGFEESSVIGDQINGDLGETLNKPLALKTDSKGWVYVTDSEQPIIRVYNASGELDRLIGHRRPTQYEVPPVFEISLDDNLTIISGQTVAKFENVSQTGSASFSSRANVVWPMNDLRQLNDGRYVISRRLGQDALEDYSEWEQVGHIRDYMLHIMNDSFSEYQDSFGEFDSLYPGLSADSDLYARYHNGHIWPTSDGDILYAPSLYRGQIARFGETSTGWKSEPEMKGFYPMEEQQTLTSLNENDAPVSNSLGVFEMLDGKIVHFSHQLINGENETVIELFGQEGSFLGFSIFDELDLLLSKEVYRQHYPIWKDEQDQFYFVVKGTSGQSPLIRVGSLTGFTNL